MDISTFNQGIQDAIPLEAWRHSWRALQKDAAALNERYLAPGDGHLIANYPVPVYLSDEVYQELQQASEQLLSAQHKILKACLATRSRREVLDLFSLPAYLEPLIDWERLEREPPTLGRMDILFAEGRRPFICEFNIDSSIGGGDAFMYLESAHRQNLHLFPDGSRLESFYESLADHLIGIARTHGKTEICFLYWETWINRGLYNLDYFMGRVRDKGFAIRKVSQVDLLEGRVPLDRCLVYKAFLKEHMGEDLDRVLDLMRKGMLLISDFGDEIYCSKAWFGLLHDVRHGFMLTRSEKEAIHRYIPQTVFVGGSTLPELIRTKDRWIFKPVDSYGGEGILVGAETGEEELWKLSSAPDGQWIAQAFIGRTDLSLPNGEDREYQDFNAVFGLYKVGDAYSGLLLRLSQVTKIVNISGGKSYIGWAVPVATSGAATPEPAPCLSSEGQE